MCKRIIQNQTVTVASNIGAHDANNTPLYVTLNLNFDVSFEIDEVIVRQFCYNNNETPTLDIFRLISNITNPAQQPLFVTNDISNVTYSDVHFPFYHKKLNNQSYTFTWQRLNTLTLKWENQTVPQPSTMYSVLLDFVQYEQ